MLYHLFVACAAIAYPGRFTRAAAPSRAAVSLTSTVSKPAETTAPPFTEIQNSFDAVVMKTYSRVQIAIERGEGCYLWDTSGKRYLDCGSGIATACLGHAHPALIEAITAQLKKVHHTSNLYYIPPQGELARMLTDRSPTDKVFFCNSGAEANEAAIKLARKHARGRGITEPFIISATSSFHGRTLATVAATGQFKYQEPFLPMPTGFVHTPYNDVEGLRNMVRQIERAAPFGLGRKKRLAAILLEPLQGEGGIRPGDKAFFEEARKICDEHGALLMFDEVQTGIGRTGKFWGHEHIGVTPDVITCAKALGGGVPIGAMLCTEAANVFAPGDHASTYGGNFLATAAGVTVLKEIERCDLLKNVEQRGEQLRAGLNALVAQSAGKLVEVRGWGLLVGVEIADSAGVTAAQVTAAAAVRGCLLVPAGPKVVRFVPPLVISESEIAEAITIFKASFEDAVAAAKAS
ncbi:acetylornithine and succinylornithine aminotransferase [Pavlovales sp. CCMP2436]|nr:acetylornithine and succinylornithine aminotransferase [Pavlovales sp. CCMP2436]|mmetsp:Transcript_35896/g.83182  ORF Transcript_35896/g.83182 Transcript_35896/m.83182 type:complete len:463 (-) Transcript_35896:303-1691(-)